MESGKLKSANMSDIPEDVMNTASDRVEGPDDHSHLAEADDRGGPDSELPATPPEPAEPGGVQLSTTSERIEGPADHRHLPAAEDRGGPDPERPATPPSSDAAAAAAAAASSSSIYVEPTIDTTVSDEVEQGAARPPPDSPGARLSAESVRLEDGFVPTASEPVERPEQRAALSVAPDRDGGDAESEASLYVLPSAHRDYENPTLAGSELVAAVGSAASPTATTTVTGDEPVDAPRARSSLAVTAVRRGDTIGSSPSLSEAARSLSKRTLMESCSELDSESSMIGAFSGKIQLVHVPTILLEASESEARRMVGLPPPQPEPTLLETIWTEPVKFLDIRSILSQIWAKDETVFHSLLSEIWESPPVRSALSDIWADAVQTVEPKSVLSEIWADPPVHVDVRSVLSQIWSEDNKQRVLSILSDIWRMPAMRSILSEIWGSDEVLSVLSEIWTTPVEFVDIRSILSQIWSTDKDVPPPHSILSEIWETPAMRAVLSDIWGSPLPVSVLWEIWKEPVHMVDIRSVLSQIWSADNDPHVRSILSGIWATPAVRAVLSEIWQLEEDAGQTADTRADYRVTESEMLLEELIEDLQKPLEVDVSQELAAGDHAADHSEEEQVAETDSSRRHRVRRYEAATDDDELPASRPLTTRWAFGGSSKAPVINLTRAKSKCIVYAAAQCIVIYDYQKNSQRIMQGHRNCVCGLAASPDGRWIASGDIGHDNALIVWDAAASAPLQMHFPSWMLSGPLMLAFTCDCRLVVGLWGCVSGAADGGSALGHARQQLIVWDWTVDEAEPKVLHDFGTGHGYHEHLAVSHLNPLMLASTATCGVVFFDMTDPEVETHRPQLRNKYSPDFKCNPGNFSQTAFSTDDPYAAVTCTSKGYVILWSDRRPSAPIDPEKLPPSVKKEARKVLQISQSPITCVQFTDGIICTGTAGGEIRFMDGGLRLLQWYQQFELAAVRCLSFSMAPAQPESAAGDSQADSSAAERTSILSAVSEDESAPFPGDCTLEAAPFVVRDLVVTTADGFCGLVHVRTSRCTTIAHFPVVPVRALHVHATKPQVVIGAYDGTVRVFDYERKQLAVETQLDGNNRVHSVAFSPSGLHLAVGMDCGELVLLDGLTLQQQCPRIELSRAAITQCLFSPDSHLLATRDDDLVVSVYRFVADSQRWVVLGRYRAHHKPVVDLLFVPSQTDPTQQRLLSLGEDRVLVEYDLVNSTRENPLVLCCDTLEQQAVPLCMALYPPLTAETFILVSNSQYKMKLYNAHTRMCRRVVLGPQYGAPLERIKVVPRTMTCDSSTVTSDGSAVQEQHSYMAFATCGHLGLQILPISGNQRQAVAVIGHPTKVETLDCSPDGRWLFSAGGEDGCVFMWEIYPESLEALSLLGGTGMTPFYDQLPGGMDGRMYQQLEDLVYYTGLLCQGEDLLDTRKVSQCVPLHMVTDILRAIGFFPTEKEVKDIMHEVRYGEYGETGALVAELHLDDVIRLYLNHRPVSAATGDQVDWALQSMARGARHRQDGAISRRELLRALQATGEHFSEKELAGVLAELLDPEAETLPQGVPLDTVERQLPKVFTLKTCSDLLGMPELLDPVAAAETDSWSASQSGSATGPPHPGSDSEMVGPPA